MGGWGLGGACVPVGERYELMQTEWREDLGCTSISWIHAK